jgi:hypothetical protein
VIYDGFGEEVCMYVFVHRNVSSLFGRWVRLANSEYLILL